jgi:hypothetical protein
MKYIGFLETCSEKQLGKIAVDYELPSMKMGTAERRFEYVQFSFLD